MMSAKAIVTLAVFFLQKPQQADDNKESCMYLLTKLSKINWQSKKLFIIKGTWIELSDTFLPEGFCYLSPYGGVLPSVKKPITHD